MTQHEIAEKYGVPQCDVSTAIRFEGLMPEKFDRPADWNETDVALALSHLYQERRDRMMKKADLWDAKADNVLRILEVE